MEQCEQSRSVYEVDPDGDLTLILRQPNAPFAVWPDDKQPSLAPESKKSSRKNKKKKKRNRSASLIFLDLDQGHDSFLEEHRPDPEPAIDDGAAVHDNAVVNDGDAPDATFTTDLQLSATVHADSPLKEFQAGTAESMTPPQEQELEIRFQLSSKHLMLSSLYFKKMLHRHWKESIVSTESCHFVDASEWDVEATTILMNIIHGRVRSVPRSVSLEMLAKIAVLVDYYKCHEVVELFADCWIQELRQSLPKEYGRELVLWLTVTWVFAQASLFLDLTEIAIKESKGPILTLDLPIPPVIIDIIDQRRQDIVDGVISGLHDLLVQLYERNECSFECSAILAGTLARQMHAHGFLYPKPVRPFLPHSVAELKTIVHDFKSPSLKTIVHDFKSPSWRGIESYYLHSCALTSLMEPIMKILTDDVSGLNLNEIQD
ncbi:hypothetical protein BX600DRAFT_439476 [Xylariales sp. PMI_506]|nr:hypothetical protein BX600DRAFT_439476 [Xylariales sp. PMI_506]